VAERVFEFKVSRREFQAQSSNFPHFSSAVFLRNRAEKKPGFQKSASNILRRLERQLLFHLLASKCELLSAPENRGFAFTKIFRRSK